MNSLSAIVRSNPELAITIALFAGISLLLTLMAVLMRSAGTSPRPIVFMAILMLPLVSTFLMAALVNARSPGTQAVATFELPLRDGHFADRAALFGADIPEAQIRDAKAVFPEFFGEAEVAELGIVGTGETVVAAQFPDAAAAQRAAQFSWEVFQITNTSGDEKRGWRGKRERNSDYIEMLLTGRHLFFWTALTKEAAASRRAASTLPTGLTANSSNGSIPLFASLQPLTRLMQPTGMKVGGILLMVALYVAWFFKGAAWASSAPAIAGVPVQTTSELTRQLEGINVLDVPFSVERGTQPNEFIATWRYADAKWVDYARVHGLRRTFRIRLVLDESGHTVRTTDYVASYDWSAGMEGARIEWHATLGIVFFQSEQQRVYGLQLDENGRFTPELSYAYQFNLDEMKAPLITAITRAGWNWRPTIWQGPAWLRWLTE
ncbi:MAG: hypothetical protein V4603_12455 [Pseudomonadota bacterium]